MNSKQYYAIVEEWRIKYNIPRINNRQSKPPIYNPKAINTCCRKCGKVKHRMARHHKANDFFFAMILPDLYAKRYCEFHPDDIDLLCNACHKAWHRYVEPKLKKMYDQSHYIPIATDEGQKKWCEEWKDQIRKWYEKWVVKPVHKKKK